MSIPFLRSPFNYDRDQVSIDTGLVFSDDDYEKCVVDQAAAKDADINEIVRRFGLTGQLPMHQLQPIDFDVTEVVDFHTAMNQVRNAEAAFLGLPAELRHRFRNDAGQLLAFLEDPANREEAEKLGLVNPAPKPVPKPAEPQSSGSAVSGAPAAS